MRRLVLFGAVFGLVLPTLAMANITAPCDSVPGNLIVNCGFETGDFTGWTQSGNTGFTGVSGDFGGISPNSGNFQAYMGPVGSDGFLSQTFGTQTGSTYQISFYEAGFGGTTSDFSANFNGITLLSQNPAPAQPYTLYTYSEVATSNTSTLTFEFRNDPSYQLLDDVSVAETAAPEPGFYGILGIGLSGLMFVVKRRGMSQSA